MKKHSLLSTRFIAYLLSGLLSAILSNISLHANTDSSLVFIDPSIEDSHILINAFDDAATVVLFKNDQDPVLQITQTLQALSTTNNSRTSDIHIVTHGSPGELSVGDWKINAETIEAQRSQLESWRNFLTADSKVVLYGCNVGQSLDFIHTLKDTTGIEIAASSNQTGNTAFGGDWEFEVQTADFEVAQIFSQEITAFSHTLPTFDMELGSGAGTGTYTETESTITMTATVDGGETWFIFDNGNSDGSLGDVLTVNSGSSTTATISFNSPVNISNFLFLDYDGSPSSFTFNVTSGTGSSVTKSRADFSGGDSIVVSPADWTSVNSFTVTQSGGSFFPAFDTLNFTAAPTNAAPTISIDNSNLAYSEPLSDSTPASQIDSVATVNDSDGNADWDSGTLAVQITGNAESGDKISILDTDGDGTTITISGLNILSNGTDIGDLSATDGIVTGGTALTITFDSDATNANVQEVLQSIRYHTTSDDPGTSNRTITVTATDASAANNSDTRTVSVTAINDEPTLSATGSNPTFTEGGSAASLFSSTTVDTIESAQTVSAFTLTVTNTNDGSNEILNLDGTAIVLTNATAGTTATNSLSYSVSVSGTTATVTLSGGTVSAAAMQTLVDAASYQNNSNDPNTSNRVVTITSLTDNGSNTGSNDNVAALAIASTVTVTALNDEPTLTATGSNPTFTEGGSAASLFSGSSISTIESGQTISGFTFTATNINDGSNEILNIDGTVIALTNANAGTTATNSLSYSVSVSGTTATITFSAGTVSTAAMQTLVNAASYQNNSSDPSTSNRVVTITSLTDSGSNTASNDNVAALAVASTVTVTALNDEPTLTATGSNPTFTEGGSAASLFSGSSVSTIESGQTVTGLTLTATNINNGSSEILNIDGTAIALTNANAGTTATNSLSYSVSVSGTTATITLSGGTVSAAAMQTLINATSYQNNSSDPNTTSRVVTITSLTDSGSNTGSNDNVAALAIASTVTVTSLNDEPTLTATGSNPTFTEDGSAASLFSGSSISTIESGQTITGFTITATNINNGSSEILNLDGTAIVLTNATAGTTATNSLSYSVSVSGTTATVTLSGGTVSAAYMQTLIDAASYQNNSSDPNTTSRVITITSLTDSGSNTGSNDNVATLAVASTVTLTSLNDEPTLTATGSNPTFTEGGSAASLFSGSSVSTIESGQTISGFTITATNINNGSSEILNLDGTAIVLTNATAGTTATNSLSYNVSVSGTTATITLSGGTVSATAMQTLINATSYQNNSNDPNTTSRVITITSLTDSGSNTGSNDNVAALAIASTVTVTSLNEEPTLTATGSNPTYSEGDPDSNVFSGASVSTIEAGQTITSLTLTITNIGDPSEEILYIDGTEILLDNGNSGTTAINSLSFSVSLSGTTATLSIGAGTLSSSETQTIIDGIRYLNNSEDPSELDRVLSLIALTDSGSNTGSNDNTGTPVAVSTISVYPINDNPTLSGLPTDVTVTEDIASNLDLSASSFADVDSTHGVSVIIEVNAGSLSASSRGSVYVWDDLSDDDTIIALTATTFADINTFLDISSNIQYTGASNVHGNYAATLTITADDNDGSGELNLGSVNIHITAVNDLPTLSGLVSSATASEDTATNIDLSASSFTDIDSSGTATVTLSASAGTLTASSDNSVTVSEPGSGTLTLSGTFSDINAFLDAASNIQYTGPSNTFGVAAATITISANDGDGSGDLDLGSINVTLNDAPTGISLSSTSVGKSSGANAPIGTLSATDPNNDETHTFSLPAGLGSNASFNISGTSLLANDTADLDIGAHSITIRVTDSGSLTFDKAFTINVTDNTAPAVTSIARLDPLEEETTLSSVAYRVTFSESVSGVSIEDFALTKTGWVNGTIASVSASSGESIDVTVNSIRGAGTLRLDFDSSETDVVDAADNEVASDFENGETYSITATEQSIFFGLVTGNSEEQGDLAAQLSISGDKGTILGYLPGLSSGFVVEFVPDANGGFRVETTPIETPQVQPSSVSTVTPQTETWTFQGQVSGNMITGTINELSYTFSILADPTSGDTSESAGYYTAESLDTDKSKMHSIIGTDGDVFALAILSDIVIGDLGLLDDSTGEFSIPISTDTRIEGQIDPESAQLESTLVQPLTGETSFGGLRTDVVPNNHLFNLSSRIHVGSGENVLIAGFVIDGSEEKEILIRAIGPGLDEPSNNAILADPSITLRQGATVIASNDNWSTASNVAAIATALQDTGAFTLDDGSTDATLLLSLSPGVYTAIIEGQNGTGIALAQVYDTSFDSNNETQRLANLSSRGLVSPENDTLTLGFEVSGNAPKRMLIRGIGPKLSSQGVNAPLANPVITVFKGSTEVARNDNWSTGSNSATEIANVASEVGAFSLDPESADAAMLVTLAPGIYTAQVTSADASTGVALVEVYETEE